MGIIIFIVVGFIAGLLARALVPGDDSMGIVATTILGIVGSFVGGAIGAIFNDGKILEFNTAGLILSIIGAIVALLIYRQVARRA
ncbi:MAG: GlsB/YeaQ/YmgE family stress response membrane protein [Actinomycetales bacterium]|nr:MAG: GlsB/YeaQ/YmgE family stress response membrane protein [Actinomycetales bacterium]